MSAVLNMKECETAMNMSTEHILLDSILADIDIYISHTLH